jgi:type IV pilus assembly protein PilE
MKYAKGLTLTEVMIATTIMGIIAAVALPSYQRYVQRSQLSEAFDAMAAYRMRMDQSFHDNGNYGTGACSAAVPPAGPRFSYACALTNAGQGFMVTATGSGNMAGYTFSVDDAGNRSTTAFPSGSGLPRPCWLTKVGEC